VALCRPSASPARGIDREALVGALCQLGQVDRLGDLGSHGPLLASAGAGSLFHCLFGRDAIRMALDLLDDFPRVARATIVELARLQGVVDDARAEEEPGRILHEHRQPQDPHGVRLAQQLDWRFPYYGAVDTTPQWINLLGAYCSRHGVALLDREIVDRAGRRRTLSDSLRAALAWITRRMDDPIGGGYVWVRRAHPRGIPNQVWEDSPDSYYHADGRLFDVTRPYAPIAVQGLTYDALLAGAALLDARPNGEAVDTAGLRECARHLRRRVLDQFWQPDLGTFATALTVEPDGALRPARVVASSAGHLLASRLLDGWDAQPPRDRLIARLREPDLLAAAGVRTRSTDAARFRAGSYHNGSVWPMDTGVIADGLRRHGRPGQAANLERRVLYACVAVSGFPEFFRGDANDRLTINQQTVDAIVDGLPNRLEQPPQMVQGWTVTRVWRILRQRDVMLAPDRAQTGSVAARAMPRVGDVAVRPVRLAA
jgi:glycogen debranching enzyme